MKRRTLLLGSLAATTPQALALPTTTTHPAILEYERATGGHIGFHARNITTNQALSWRGNERFVLCSTFKASLAALILHRIDQHQDSLESRIPYGPADVPDWHAPIARANLAKGSLTVREMCEAAVQYSDNTCANLLLARAGGPPTVTAFWRGLGDTTSRLDDPEPGVNRTPLHGLRNTTTPAAMAETFQNMILGPTLTQPSKTMLKTWLIANTTGAGRFRAGLPQSWTIGDKTGNNGKDAAGDLALAWPDQNRPIVMAAYTRGGTPSEADLTHVFKALGQMVASTLA